ncbi:MAG: hypothetical protein A2V67_17720 [Deltaproteobacteria bacterium RBG_13_61_14]|nr:MAG: hypothetical protein A2V67_17720 [Deltaproteobacteria bacterium RBG_13_61_14]
MKVAEGIHLVGSADLSDPKDCCVYLVDGGEELALIDAGAGDGFARIVDNIEKAGCDPHKLTTLILTHCHIDHSAGIPDFVRRFGVKVKAHQAAAEILASRDALRTAAIWYNLEVPEITVDQTFSNSEFRLQVGDQEIVCLHTPGHSPDSISAYLDRGGKRVLFGQDIHGPFHPALGSDVALWRKSMEKLLALQADVLCEGHFGIFQPRAKVEAYIRSYLQKV